jgi:hypothetical protein
VTIAYSYILQDVGDLAIGLSSCNSMSDTAERGWPVAVGHQSGTHRNATHNIQVSRKGNLYQIKEVNQKVYSWLKSSIRNAIWMPHYPPTAAKRKSSLLMF